MNFISSTLRLLGAVVLGAFLSGCATTNSSFVMTTDNLNLNTGVREQSRMSSYLELDEDYLDGKLTVKIVTTLGDERVPSDHYFTGKYTSDGKINKKDGFIAEVTEVYFINNSNTDITLTPLNIEVSDRGRVAMEDSEMTIPAQKAKISSKHIATTGIYLRKESVKFQFLLEGITQNLDGVVKRKTVADKSTETTLAVTMP